MKISFAAVLAVSCIPATLAFVTPHKKHSSAFATHASQLHLQVAENNDRENAWFGPVVTAVAGLTMASQMAVANVDSTAPFVSDAAPTIQQVFTQQKSLTSEISSPSAISGPSIQLSKEVEYLDFSLPSYGDSAGSSATPKKDAPSFSNPFADFDFSAPKGEPAPSPAPDAVSDSSAAEEKVAAQVEKEAAEAAKKAEKEAAEAAKKAEKDAAEAAKKAEKEARRQAEKEKQRLAVERANNEAKEAQVNEAPALSLPDIKAPDFELPNLKVPDVKFEVPDFKSPDIKMPDVSMPTFSLPKVEMPKVDFPKVDAPSFSVPQSSVEKPKVPSFSTPSFGGSGKSEYESLVVDDVEPQEVRDERARAATAAYKMADASAKEIEAKAKELRNVANEKKSIAKAAKDEACKTRFGGKILCIRPFGIGY